MTVPPPQLCITVHGIPAPQGSKRHVGGGRMIESSAKVKPWREAVKHAALEAIAAREGTGDPFAILGGPLCVEATFTLRRPRGHYRTGRNAHLLRDGAPGWPASKPDTDKLLRSTGDALGDAGIYVDDAQVVELTGRKVYVDTGLDALPHPGAVIRVWQIGGA